MLSPTSSKLYEIEEKGKELSMFTCLAQHANLCSIPLRCNVQCNENSTRSYENLCIYNLYQSFIKTAINTAITVTSKVTLLNTCEKLKMTHEKQLELILGI
jgi:hypothetical protein